MENLNLAPARLRYSLAKECPCGKSNKDGKFSPDKESPEYGHCHSCNKTFFQQTEKPFVVPKPIVKVKIDHLPSDLLIKSMGAYGKNKFIQFVKSLFPLHNVEDYAHKYSIGTSKHWKGSTVFYQIDQKDNIRTGKIMLYNEFSGKRVKEPFSHFTWIHKVLKLEEFNLSQCLFGLQILKNNNKPVAIVESEKTAFIMSLADDNYNWLATGGKGNFKYEILEDIKDRKIFAFPDKGEYQMWFDISERLKEYGFDIVVSDAIELGDYPVGTDLADLLIVEKATVCPLIISTKADTNEEIQLIGIAKTFSKEDLTKISKSIIPENDSIEKSALIKSLQQLENISINDAEILIDILKFRDIISQVNDFYFLTSSTPF